MPRRARRCIILGETWSRGDRVFSEIKDNYLKQLYRTNPQTNAYIVDISLANYDEIFNEWDPSPAGRRDLDPDLVSYIEQCSQDIPLKFPLELQFHMPKKEADPDKEQKSRDGLSHYLAFTAHTLSKNHGDVFRRALIYAIAAFIFITIGYVPKQATDRVLVMVLNEGLSIVGWVLLWEAFSLVLFSGQEASTRVRTYKRFLNADVVFKYE